MMETRRTKIGLSCGAIVACLVSSPNYATDRAELSQQLQRSIELQSGGQGLNAFQMPAKDDLAGIPQDPANPITREKVTLGRFLYHDTATGTEGTDPDRVSTWSCASCHHVKAGFKAGVPQGIGDGGVGFGADGSERLLVDGLDATAPAGDSLLPDLQPIASPTILNVAFQDVMLWNGSFGNAPGSVNGSVATVDGAGPPPIKANTFGLSGIETQVLAGTNVHRLRFDRWSVLQSNSEYQYLYQQAFPDGDTGYIPDNGTAVSAEALGAAKAIAAYERIVLSNLAPFQRWLSGSRDAMSVQQLEGANLFFGKAGCAGCHSGPALSSRLGASADEMFFAIGFNDFDVEHPHIHGVVDDATKKGRGGFTKNPADNYKFKIPQRYNLTDTTVFGHGASFSSVREVIEYKNAGVAQNPDAVDHLSDKFVPLGLSEHEIDDLVVFIEEGLHDQWLDRYVPHSVPSDQCFPVADLQSALDLGCITGSSSVNHAVQYCESASSDPDGDGWGWENEASCLVVAANGDDNGDQQNDPQTDQPSNRHPACVSAASDSDGDGWGWENSRSCKVVQ